MSNISAHLRSSSLRVRPDNCSLLKRIMAWRILDRLISESLQTNEVDSEAEVMVVPSFSSFRQCTTCVALICLSGRFLTNYTTIMWHDPDCFALLKNMQLLRPIHQQASDRLSAGFGSGYNDSSLRQDIRPPFPRGLLRYRKGL